MDVTRRFLVLGRVQGVYFRHSTRLEAEKLALRGMARNLADGSVEILAGGDATAIGQLRSWLRHGPPHARVDEVRETAAADEMQLPDGFLIL